MEEMSTKVCAKNFNTQAAYPCAISALLQPSGKFPVQSGHESANKIKRNIMHDKAISVYFARHCDTPAF